MLVVAAGKLRQLLVAIHGMIIATLPSPTNQRQKRSYPTEVT